MAGDPRFPHLDSKKFAGETLALLASHAKKGAAA
jgi:hypothetical protein